MFLATTALREFWDRSDRILFLGRWCLRQDRRADWAGLPHRVLDCPWDDRKRFAAAAQYVEQCYEALLAELAEYMNAVHHVTRSPRYWRVLVGPWLLHYVHAVYDRYVHLEEALDAEPSLSTIVLDPGSYRVPADTLDAVVQLRDHDFHNLQMFSELLAATGHRFPTRPGGPEVSRPSTPAGWRARTRAGARWTLTRAARLARPLRARWWRAALCDMEVLGRRSAWRLATASRLRALPARVPALRGGVAPVFDVRRHGLAGLRATDRIQQLMVRLMPTNLPALYLEGYESARQHAARPGLLPGVVVSSVGWYYNEAFKFAAAEAEVRGARLVGSIHGGGYGIFRFNPSQRHEESLADSYLVWGDWAAADGGGRRRMVPPPKLSAFCRSRRGGVAPERHGQVLFVATTGERYVSRFQSIPVCGQWAEYHAWQGRFLAAVPGSVRASVVFRPHPGGPHPLREQLGMQFPEVRWDASGSFYDGLERSRLVVIDNLETTVLESLAADVPTLLYWDPRLWEVCEGAAPYLERLRAAGILWDGPEGAAAKLAEIHESARAWWDTDVVKDARRAFVRRYADVRPDWLRRWRAALSDEIAASRRAGGRGSRRA